MSENTSQRIDKWLWHARFFKTRSLASKIVAAGKVRVDGAHISKPSRAISPGMVLTFPQAQQVRVVRVLAIGDRRGPATEAQTLFEDLTPTQDKPPANSRYDGKGRPTGRDRRNMASHLRDKMS